MPGRTERTGGDGGWIIDCRTTSAGRGGGVAASVPQVSIWPPQQGQTSMSWPVSSRRRSCQRRGGTGSGGGAASSLRHERQLRTAMAVGEEADVTDAVKAVGHGVLQEAADELVGRAGS